MSSYVNVYLRDIKYSTFVYAQAKELLQKLQNQTEISNLAMLYSIEFES